MPHDDDEKLTEREELIAQRAAELAIEQVYMRIGESVVKKVFWLVGLVSVGLLMFLSGKGVIAPH